MWSFAYLGREQDVTDDAEQEIHEIYEKLSRPSEEVLSRCTEKPLLSFLSCRGTVLGPGSLSMQLSQLNENEEEVRCCSMDLERLRG